MNLSGAANQSTPTTREERSEERRLLEEIKMKRHQERHQLLSLKGIRPIIDYCKECRRELYEGSSMANGLCERCVQRASIERTQSHQLHKILNRFRDEALHSGTLLANALFDPPQSEIPQTSTHRRSGRGRKRSLDSSTNPVRRTSFDFTTFNDNDLESDEFVESTELFCHIKKCADKDSWDELLVCDMCQRGFHARCCEPPLHYHLAIRYPWLCTMDKVCTSCRTTEKESSMLLCDGCDRSFHSWCSVPPVKHVPEGEWFCADCSICSICKHTLTSEDIKSPLSYGFKNMRICSECVLKQPKIKLKLCTVCYEIKEPHEVLCQCSGCDQEVHRDCCRPGPSFPIWCYECLGLNDESMSLEDSKEGSEDLQQHDEQEMNGSSSMAMSSNSLLPSNEPMIGSDDGRLHHCSGVGGSGINCAEDGDDRAREESTKVDEDHSMKGSEGKSEEGIIAEKNQNSQINSNDNSKEGTEDSGTVAWRKRPLRLRGKTRSEEIENKR